MSLAAQASVLLDAELEVVTAAHPELPVEREITCDTPRRTCSTGQPGRG